MDVQYRCRFFLYSRLHRKIQNLWEFKANAAFVSLTHPNTLTQKPVLGQKALPDSALSTVGGSLVFGF